jgi:hypothetical protein
VRLQLPSGTGGAYAQFDTADERKAVAGKLGAEALSGLARAFLLFGRLLAFGALDHPHKLRGPRQRSIQTQRNKQ